MLVQTFNVKHYYVKNPINNAALSANVAALRLKSQKARPTGGHTYDPGLKCCTTGQRAMLCNSLV